MGKKFFVMLNLGLTVHSLLSGTHLFALETLQICCFDDHCYASLTCHFEFTVDSIIVKSIVTEFIAVSMFSCEQ